MIALFADAVNVGGHSQISMINGGKTDWICAEFPIQFDQPTLVLVPRETLLPGPHPFKFEVVDQVGEVVCGMEDEGMELPDADKNVTLSFKFLMRIPRAGKYTLLCTWGPKAYTLPLTFRDAQ